MLPTVEWKAAPPFCRTWDEDLPGTIGTTTEEIAVTNGTPDRSTDAIGSWYPLVQRWARNPPIHIPHELSLRRRDGNSAASIGRVWIEPDRIGRTLRIPGV